MQSKIMTRAGAMHENSRHIDRRETIGFVRAMTTGAQTNVKSVNLPLHLILDEADPDPAIAAGLAREIAAEACTVRLVRDQRYPMVAKADHELLDRLRCEGIRYHCVSPGIGKIPYDHAAATTAASEEMPRAVEGAVGIGAVDISVFSWLKTESATHPVRPGELSPSAPRKQMAETLHLMAAMAAAAGLTLSIEVGHQCWADSGHAAWRLIKEADHPALRVLWDPCNAIGGCIWWSRRGGSPSPPPEANAFLEDDLTALPDCISSVHVRDMVAVSSAPGWAHVLIGEGILDWPGIVRRLLERGYQGPLTIEHHMPAVMKARATRHTAAYLAGLGILKS